MADSVPAPGSPPRPPGAAPAAVADLAAIVLAAGEGRRLLPLTRLLPKPLCPVANRPLVDLAIDAVAAATGAIAVNVHHGRAALEPHLRARGDVHVSIEPDQALGTAGAVGHLRPWLDGRAVLVVNGDSWSRPDLASFAAGWDGARVRILVAGDEPFGPRSQIVASLLPWSVASGLAAEPSGLYEACWRAAAAAGAVESVGHHGPFVDCGTPARYLRANRWAAAIATGTAAGRDLPDPSLAGDLDHDLAGTGSVVHPSAVLAPGAEVVGSVIGPGARIEGCVRASVVWGGTTVARGERLEHAIRAAARVTVAVR